MFLHNSLDSLRRGVAEGGKDVMHVKLTGNRLTVLSVLLLAPRTKPASNVSRYSGISSS